MLENYLLNECRLTRNSQNQQSGLSTLQALAKAEGQKQESEILADSKRSENQQERSWT